MLLEAVMLYVKDGLETGFELSFKPASSLISSINGYLSHELHKCIEVKGKYLLLVRWDLEAHTVTFRSSPKYKQWKQLLHHYYEPFPTVEHFEEVILDK